MRPFLFTWVRRFFIAEYEISYFVRRWGTPDSVFEKYRFKDLFPLYKKWFCLYHKVAE